MKSIFIITLLTAFSCTAQTNIPMEKTNYTPEVVKTDEEWRKQLSPEEFYVSRQGGTEAPGTGKFYMNKEKGVYTCVSCNAPLFTSDSKYDSGSGWPAFFQPIDENSIREIRDTSHGMIRIEVRCKKCDGHLGHVFEDGPKPTGLRYCVNSASLDFEKGDR